MALNSGIQTYQILYSKSFLYFHSCTIQILFDPLLKKFHNRTDTNLYSLVATIYILMIFCPNMILTQHITWPTLGFLIRRYFLTVIDCPLFVSVSFFADPSNSRGGIELPQPPPPPQRLSTPLTKPLILSQDHIWPQHSTAEQQSSIIKTMGFRLPRH